MCGVLRRSGGGEWNCFHILMFLKNFPLHFNTVDICHHFRKQIVDTDCINKTVTLCCVFAYILYVWPFMYHKRPTNVWPFMYHKSVLVVI